MTMADDRSARPLPAILRRNRDRLILALVGVALGAVFLFAIFSGRVANGPSGPAVLASALMMALASCFLGGLLGFLFGIPRRLQQQAAASQDGADLGLGPGYETNTNLEQISDWLTKILVGVGLVQLANLGTVLDKLGAFAEGALGAGPGRVIGVCLILFFFVLGFLVGYVWTRTRLADEFSQTERDGRVQPQFYEGLMHAYLYLPAPTGFERTLDVWRKFEKRFPDARNDRTWTYVACAYGQKYRFSSSRPTPDAAALEEECRRAAFEAIQAAVEYSPGAKEGLALLLNGADGGDLLPFKGRKEFQDLVA